MAWGTEGQESLSDETTVSGGVRTTRRALLGGGTLTFAGILGQHWANAQETPPDPPPPDPSVPQPAVSIHRGPTTKSLVSLTWDCGADRGYAPSILNTLASTGIKVSFGLTGQWAQANADLVERMVTDGHHLFNHTFSHRSFTGTTSRTAALTSAERKQELESTEAVITELTGAVGRPYFRPPFGDFDNSVLTDLGANGFTHNLMWTLDVNGWRGLTQDQIVARVMANHGNGYIYLLHVGGQSMEGPALPRIISGLRAKGYAFTTIPDLLSGTEPAPPRLFQPGDSVRVTAGLYLRSEPSRFGRVLTTMPTGTVCTVLGGPTAADGFHWYHLQTPYGSGWAAGEYLALTTAPPPPPPAGTYVPGDKLRVTSAVRLRMAPSLSGGIITTMPTGTVCTVVAGPTQADGYTWYQVQTPYGTGWAASSYLAKVTTSPPPPSGTFVPGDRVQATANVRLRSAAGLSGSIIGTLPAGAVGTVLAGPTPADGYSWYRLQTAYGTGWAAGAYLQRA